MDVFTTDLWLSFIAVHTLGIFVKTVIARSLKIESLSVCFVADIHSWVTCKGRVRQVISAIAIFCRVRINTARSLGVG